MKLKPQLNGLNINRFNNCKASDKVDIAKVLLVYRRTMYHKLSSITLNILKHILQIQIKNKSLF